MSIQDIVVVSGNERWTVNIAHIKTDAEFLSRHNKYHKHCHTGNCLTAPELARLGFKESERLVATTTSSPHHHQLSQSIIVRQERFIAHLKSVLAPCNSFQTEVASESSDSKYRIFKLMSKEIIPDEVQQSILAKEEYVILQIVCRGTHNREAQFVGHCDKSQAEDMDVRWKRHYIEHKD